MFATTFPYFLQRWLRGSKPLLTALALLLGSTAVCAQNVADSFLPQPNAPVRALVVQNDGRILVGGDYTQIAGVTRRALSRLNADGEIDLSFGVQIGNGEVHAIALQPDGRVVIGGSFTQIGVSVRQRIARLNTDGSVDPSFNPGANDLVRSLLIEPDGAILVGGDFTQIGGQTRNRLARVSASGTLDADFQPSANASVRALARLSDGRIWAGGDFTQIGPFPRSRLARLHPNGGLDQTQTRTANATVHSIVVDVDGSTLIGGEFTQILVAVGPAVVRNRLARFAADGQLMAFDPNANGTVFGLDVRSDGDVLVAGDFTQVGGQQRIRYARLSPVGELRTGMGYGPNGGPSLVVAADPVGRTLLGGSWFGDQPGGVGGAARLLRIYDELGLERPAHSMTDANAVVFALASNPSGQTLVAGRFTGFGGFPRGRGALFNMLLSNFDPELTESAGLIEALAVAFRDNGAMIFGGLFNKVKNITNPNYAFFHPGGGFATSAVLPNSRVNAMAVQSDGKLLLAGSFTQLHNQTRQRIGRLNADGSLDTGFNIAVDGAVLALALQADGKIVIGGEFNQVGGQPRSRIARLHGDGSLDTGFNASAVGDVFALAVEADGRILVGGAFTTFNGVGRARLARVHSDGSLDSLNPAPNAPVYAIAALVNGQIMVAGGFNQIGGQSRGRLARLHNDGSVDLDFSVNANNSIHSLLVHPEGRLMIGGVFTNLDGVAHERLARLGVAVPVTSSLAVEGSSVIWRRGGPGPELAQAPQLQFSLDGVSYSPIATMTRIAGGWSVSGFEPPVNQIYYLRVRARPGPAGVSLFEVTTRLLGGVPDLIMATGFES